MLLQIILICATILSFLVGLWPIGLVMLPIALLSVLNKKQNKKQKNEVEESKKRVAELEKDAQQ